MSDSMKGSISKIALLFLFSSTAKAGVIFSESFETDGLNQRYYSAQEGSFDGPRSARDWHWQRQSANQSGNTNFYTNADGKDFWSGINLDENGSSTLNPSTLTFNSISLAGFTNASLEIDLASSSGLERTDFLSIFAINIASNQKTLIDSFESGASIINENDLSSTFQTLKYSLNYLGLNSFKLSFDAFSNASKESFAIDNIRILAEPSKDVTDVRTNDEQNAIAVDAPNHLPLLAMFGIGLWLRKGSN